jgi:hypothetical protein
MCGKCTDIDQRIARYRRFAKSMVDPQTETALKQLLREAEREKAAFRCEAPDPIG